MQHSWSGSTQWVQPPNDDMINVELSTPVAGQFGITLTQLLALYEVW